VATWGTVTELKRRFKGLLRNHSFQIQTGDDQTFTDALQDSHNTIVTALVARGYTAAQINTWSQRLDYEYRIAVCNVADYFALFRGDGEEWITEKFCVAEDLEEIKIVEDDGSELVPGAPAVVGLDLLDLEALNDNIINAE